MTLSLRPTLRRVGLGGATVAVAVVLAACSSSAGGSAGGTSGADGAAPSAAPGSGATGGTNGGAGTGGFQRSAASGQIAQVSGRTLQVQSTSAQTAVSWSATTTFTLEKKSSLAAVTKGSCVFATAARPVTGSSASSGSSGSSSAATGPVTALTATAVRITAGSGGTCRFGTRAGGYPGGQRPSGMPSGARPSGAPSGARPSGAPSGTRGFGGGLVGTVTAVHGSTITVRTVARSTSGSTTSSETGTITVTSATTYSSTARATGSAAKVGLCAVVQGKTDAKGAVSASAIALSPATNGTCTVGGPGGRAPGGGAPGAPGGGNG